MSRDAASLTDRMDRLAAEMAELDDWTNEQITEAWATANARVAEVQAQRRERSTAITEAMARLASDIHKATTDPWPARRSELT